MDRIAQYREAAKAAIVAEYHLSDLLDHDNATHADQYVRLVYAVHDLLILTAEVMAEAGYPQMDGLARRLHNDPPPVPRPVPRANASPG